jgi:hypothetical protein
MNSNRDTQKYSVAVMERVTVASSQKKSAPVLSKAVRTVLDQQETTSAKIRFLAGQGFTAGDIKRTLNVSHQHAYNVMHQPFKGTVPTLTATKTAVTETKETTTETNILGQPLNR